MRKAILFSMLLLAGVQAGAAQPVTTTVDTERSVIQYSGSAVVHDWTGVSNRLTGTLVLDFASPSASRIELSAPVESFESGNSNRDSNMLDAVEVDRYPNVTFVSTEVRAVQDGMWNVKGNLTFHGKTHPVELPVRVGMNPTLFEAQGAFDVSLTQFGVRRPKLLMRPIQDVIKIEFTVRAPLGAGQ